MLNDPTFSEAKMLFDLALNRSGFPSLSILSGKGFYFASDIEQVGVKTIGTLSQYSEEDLSVVYKEHRLVPFSGTNKTRPFVRYDFQKEWNNRGFGKIQTLEGNGFSCANRYFLGTNYEVLAEVFNSRTGEKVSDYAAIFNRNGKVCLWFNRPVGPIDGFDWVIVENFLSMYNADSVTLYPSVAEIPFGFDGAVTMRIDCDEAIGSGRQLFELYRAHQMPFSMAIKTNQTISSIDIQLMRDVIAAGGSVVGHSHTHAPNWGGSAESAKWEVQESSRVLSDLDVSGISYDYVVSPFHQNSRESIEGLRNAGIKGFVGGIICNDPEYLLARAGAVPGVPGIISHSQQCMLHGETFYNANGSIKIYEEAFMQALESRTFFGFLDHPFSNYWYGWKSESDRLNAHEQFLKFLTKFPKVWKASLVDAMRFLEMKSTVKIEQNFDSFTAILPHDDRFKSLPPVSIIFGSKVFALKLGDRIAIA